MSFGFFPFWFAFFALAFASTPFLTHPQTQSVDWLFNALNYTATTAAAQLATSAESLNAFSSSSFVVKWAGRVSEREEGRESLMFETESTEKEGLVKSEQRQLLLLLWNWKKRLVEKRLHLKWELRWKLSFFGVHFSLKVKYNFFAPTKLMIVLLWLENRYHGSNDENHREWTKKMFDRQKIL